jgi:anti-sigma regulatory factor (Ser/Thr protein kinase)
MFAERRKNVVCIPKSLSLNETYPPVAASIPRARNAVVEFARGAGCSEPQIDSLRLAVTEAVTNAVLHGFETEAGKIQLTIARVSDEVWVLIADDGCGFLHPRRRSHGLGWGLALIADACDDFEIAERASGGTELRMRFVHSELAVV